MSQSAPATTIVELDSDLIGQDPEALKQVLLGALVAGRPVAVRAANVSRAGTAALQLLVAFLREARRKGLAVEVCEISGALRDAVCVTGLESELGLSSGSAEPT